MTIRMLFVERTLALSLYYKQSSVTVFKYCKNHSWDGRKDVISRIDVSNDI